VPGDQPRGFAAAELLVDELVVPGEGPDAHHRSVGREGAGRQASLGKAVNEVDDLRGRQHEAEAVGDDLRRDRVHRHAHAVGVVADREVVGRHPEGERDRAARARFAPGLEAHEASQVARDVAPTELAHHPVFACLLALGLDRAQKGLSRGGARRPRRQGREGEHRGRLGRRLGR
jgi:hypothetical protein